MATTTKKPAAPAKGKPAPAKTSNKALSTEVKTGGALATSDAALFASSAGAGMENVTARDILIPRIGIIQALSPQVQKSKPEYNPAAKVGMIYDVGLGEPIGDEMIFCPILYQKVWLEWYPRNTGKGLAKIHTDDSILQHTENDERGRPVLENGNYIQETAQFYGLNLSAGGRLSFIPMASTQLKKARQWLTMATNEKLKGEDGREFTPPLFYRTYKLTVNHESNSEGDWEGWVIEKAAALPDLEDWQNMFATMKETHAKITGGVMRADMSNYDGEGAAASSGSSDNSGAM